jgi:hypothetical protein
LGHHQGQQSGSRPDIQYPLRLAHLYVSSKHTGIRADFHRALVLVYPELLELEVGIGHGGE